MMIRIRGKDQVKSPKNVSEVTQKFGAEVKEETIVLKKRLF